MKYIIFCEDKPESFELRAKTRPSHLEYMNQFDIGVGGPMIDEEGRSVGSCLITELDSLEAAHELAANDPYNLAGLFASVRVSEFKTVLWPTGEA